MLGFGGLSPLLEQHQLLNKLKLNTLTHSGTTQREESTVSVGGLWRGAVSGLCTAGKKEAAVASVCTRSSHSHLRQKKALSIPSLAQTGKALASHGPEAFSPWHDCAHVNSMRSAGTWSALYTSTQGLLCSPQKPFSL